MVYTNTVVIREMLISSLRKMLTNDKKFKMKILFLNLLCIQQIENIKKRLYMKIINCFHF